MILPAGLDPLNYGYSIFSSIVLNDGEFYKISNPGWLVLRVQVAMRADQGDGAEGSVAFANGTVPIYPGGCICLEPSAMFRGEIFVHQNEAGAHSDGMRITIEYAWKATTDATQPPTTMVVT